MITTEKLTAVRTIVTHEHCPDGIASAILLRDALPDAYIEFVQYGTPEHRDLVAGPGLLFCDMTPPRERVAEFVAAGAVVLDHHRGAADIVAAFGADGVFADEATNPGTSGAMLAFLEVWTRIRGGMFSTSHPGSVEQNAALAFASLAGIRDTWQRASPRWDAACEQAAALRFWPVSQLLSIAEARPFAHEQLGEKMAIGPILIQRQAEAVERAVGNALSYTTRKGTRLLIFEGTTLTSDAAEAVGDHVDLVIGFHYEVEPHGPTMIRLSTRSHTTYDCAALAKHYGGGGHTKAAGFSQPCTPASPNPYNHIIDLLTRYETAAQASVAADGPVDRPYERNDWGYAGPKGEAR